MSETRTWGIGGKGKGEEVGQAAFCDGCDFFRRDGGWLRFFGDGSGRGRRGGKGVERVVGVWGGGGEGGV